MSVSEGCKTKMTAKEYLRQARRYEILINCKKDRIEELQDMLTSVSSALGGDRVQGTKSSDKIGDGIAKLIDLQLELNADMVELIEKRREIGKTIDSLEDDRQVQLLYFRYFKYKSWEEIADEMGYTLRWSYLIHGDALREIEKRLH